MDYRLSSLFIQQVSENKCDKVKEQLFEKEKKKRFVGWTFLLVAKKLVGHSAATAFWSTDVGKEKRQVVMSVLTDREGQGHDGMVQGFIRWYKDASQSASVLTYVDQDCCPNGGQRKMFKAWPGTLFHQDIWHFMRRFTVGCTSDAHQLYQTFLGHQCIFEYSREDLDALMAAKRMEIGMTSIRSLPDNDVLHRFSKEKLAVPWRRQTRGVEGTTRLIHELLAFDGARPRLAGCSTAQLPQDLGHGETIKSHIACILGCSCAPRQGVW